ncbi:hypothetical protein BGX21_002209 [Mortierella sp. AD011]|nr:hypothetical protein BGX20_009391 [Mortierella sp. AD010]KAF9380991.1 hypothetical protein BGX21_002209 [Mortierella sp. AD011]
MSEKTPYPPMDAPSYPGTPAPLYPGVAAPSYSGYPVQFNQQVRVCCISLNESDKIRLIGTPPELTLPIRQAIAGSWGPIQREGIYSGVPEFKLLGNPWYGQGVEAVNSRRLITAILRTMAQCGWNLIQAADVSKKERDKDSLFFETSVVPDVGQVDMFSMSFNRTDRIRLIDAPEFVTSIVKGAILMQWRQGINMEQKYHKSHEFKLNGNPFWADGFEAVTSRVMLSQILAALRAQGYKLYSSVDISSGNDGHDVESWVFRRIGPAWS